MTLLVRHAMTAEPKALSPDRSASDAAGLMAQFDVGSIPVVERDRVVGVVTDRDIVVRVIAKRRDPNDVRLDEIVTETIETVSPDAELSDARAQMERARIRRLPVAKDGRLVGVLSLGDVAVALASKREVGNTLEQISRSESTSTLNDGPAVGTPRTSTSPVIPSGTITS